MYRHGIIEILDSSFHIKEAFTLRDIEALGWSISYPEYGILMKKNRHADIVVRTWPVDSFGRTSRHNLNTPQISGSPAGAMQG
ncbi:MAG TPA: hypothetical protein VET88_03025, partial [Gammaproteobacteria bacterium]|nr:hypothetical protein [Gammaproteobacteria bacterium]